MKFLPGLIGYPRNREVGLRSSAISWVKYQPRMKELDVSFASGELYQYGCVEPDAYKQLLRADSPGGYFTRNIRGNYPYRKLY